MVRDADIEREAENAIDPEEIAATATAQHVISAEEPPEEHEEGGEEGGEDNLPEGTVILYDESGQAYLGIPIETETETEGEGEEEDK